MSIPVLYFLINYLVLCVFLIPFCFISLVINGAKALSNTFRRLFPVETVENFMCSLGAFLVDIRTTFIMDLGHISEEEEAFVLAIDLFMYALLSQIFKNNLLSCELVAVVGGAILSSRKAVGRDEFVTAVLALPVDEVGGHQDLIAKFLVDVLEILDEIKN